MKTPLVPLSAMMFLQFFIWGAWYVSTGPFAAAQGWTGQEIGWIYSVGPIAAIVTPIFLGMIADRFFATQKVLGVLHLLGAGLLFALPQTVELGAPTFSWVVFAYMLCYMPTLGLTNTLAFHHITDQEKQFPIVRVFGTLGWIAAGTIIGAVLAADESVTQYYVAGGASVLMGLFSFLLPHTPPPAAGKSVSLVETLGLGAIGMLAKPNYLIFMLASFLICIPLAGYYSFAAEFAGTAFESPTFIMSFGQWAEVFFMLVMPLFFARLGVKWMLAVGMAAWVLRYVLFSYGAGTPETDAIRWMILGGILLHGICYDFFFVTGQIYTDQASGPRIRAQAQSFLVVMTQGVGMLIGANLMGGLADEHTVGEGDAAVRNWGEIWWMPAMGALGILIFFVLFFRKPKPALDVDPGTVPATGTPE